jgi:hypothetical protein
MPICTFAVYSLEFAFKAMHRPQYFRCLALAFTALAYKNGDMRERETGRQSIMTIQIAPLIDLHLPLARSLCLYVVVVVATKLHLLLFIYFFVCAFPSPLSLCHLLIFRGNIGNPSKNPEKKINEPKSISFCESLPRILTSSEMKPFFLCNNLWPLARVLNYTPHQIYSKHSFWLSSVSRIKNKT